MSIGHCNSNVFHRLTSPAWFNDNAPQCARYLPDFQSYKNSCVNKFASGSCLSSLRGLEQIGHLFLQSAPQTQGDLLSFVSCQTKVHKQTTQKLMDVLLAATTPLSAPPKSPMPAPFMKKSPNIIDVASKTFSDIFTWAQNLIPSATNQTSAISDKAIAIIGEKTSICDNPQNVFVSAACNINSVARVVWEGITSVFAPRALSPIGGNTLKALPMATQLALPMPEFLVPEMMPTAAPSNVPPTFKALPMPAATEATASFASKVIEVISRKEVLIGAAIAVSALAIGFVAYKMLAKTSEAPVESPKGTTPTEVKNFLAEEEAPVVTKTAPSLSQRVKAIIATPFSMIFSVFYKAISILSSSFKRIAS